MKNICVIGILLSIVFLSGCVTRVGDFTALSTKNIYCKNIDVSSLPKQRVEGESVAFLGIGANLKDATDEAIEKAGGNLMIDAAFYRVSGLFWGGYKIEGTVVNVPYQK